MFVYGSIKVLATKKELDWDGTRLITVLRQLDDSGLTGKSEYGVDWIYSGDLDEKEGDIYLSLNLTGKTFYGKHALQDFLNFVNTL